MSNDQRPGKVRLFTSTPPQEAPQRRRGDLSGPGEPDAAGPLYHAVPYVPERRPRPSMLPMLSLFMLGSALGGMFVAALGLFKVPGL